MPLALNAIFGIPTREEKFTAARDQKLQDFHKELMGEQERIRREGDEYDWTAGKKRLTSTLAGSGLFKPEEVDASVNQALAAGQMGNIYKAREIAGGMPLAEESGRTSTLAGIEGNNAAAAEAQARSAEARNRRTAADTKSSYVPSLIMGEIGLQDAQAAAGTQTARTARKSSLLADDILDATRSMQISNAVGAAQAQPQILQQTLESGRQGLDYGKTRNEMLNRENSQAARLEGGLSTLYKANPDMLTAPIRAQAAEADRIIKMSKAIRDALADPRQRPYILKMIRASNQSGDWRQNMPDATSLAPNMANDPMLQELSRFINPTQ